jgi:hypothetical protein
LVMILNTCSSISVAQMLCKWARNGGRWTAIWILTPRKLKTLSSLSCILAPGFFLVIPSRMVFSLSQYILSSSVVPFSVLVLYWPSFSTVLLSWQTNPLKVALGVPAREHLVQQFIFLVVMQTVLSLLREPVLSYPLTGNGRYS